MNLYKILFAHSAPKDTKEGIETYLLAENDEEVYNYIDKEYNYECWRDQEEDHEIFTLYDEDCNRIGTETFHEKIMRLKGEIEDEDYDYSDAYYGITLYGWKVVEENVSNDFTNLVDLDIIRILK